MVVVVENCEGYENGWLEWLDIRRRRRLWRIISLTKFMLLCVCVEWNKSIASYALELLFEVNSCVPSFYTRMGRSWDKSEWIIMTLVRCSEFIQAWLMFLASQYNYIYCSHWWWVILYTRLGEAISIEINIGNINKWRYFIDVVIDVCQSKVIALLQVSNQTRVHVSRGLECSYIRSAK